MEIAERIHTEWCGCDDKQCHWVSDITEWLAGGTWEAGDYEVLLLEWARYYGCMDE